MTPPATVLRITAGILALLSVEPAHAQDRTCSRLALEAEASVRTRWPELLPTTRSALSQRENIDQCARVRLSSRGDSIGIEVALADGRLAFRAVSRPNDVVPTLEALLLLPWREMPSTPGPRDSASDRLAPTAAASTISAASPPHAEGVTPDGGRVSQQAIRSQRAKTHVRVELSAEMGARAGDGQSSLGFGALSFVEVSGWLVGFEGRLDRYRGFGSTRPFSSQPVSGTPEDGSGALELGVLAGRRVPLDNLAFDFFLGPMAALQGVTTVQTQTAAGTRTRSSSSTVPRLLVMSRMTWGAASTLRGFVGIEGEVGGARAAGSDVPSAPRLPRWTVGLALGATVGTR